MIDRPTFDEIIKDVLGNLYDTAAIETQPLLFEVIKLPANFTGSKGEYVRQLFLKAIEQLRPPRKEESINSPEWRPYFILYKRYVDGIGVQELSDLLAISPRQMRRDHHRAFVALCEILWNASGSNQKAADEKEPAVSSQTVEVHNEITDVVETVQGVCKTLRRRFTDKNIHVDIEPSSELTLITTDRVILRQALIGLFNQSIHIQYGHNMLVRFNKVDQQVVIEIVVEVSPAWETASDEEVDDDLNSVRYWCRLIQARLEEEIVHSKGGDFIHWYLKLPRTNQRILLVIDDQTTVLNLFKRYLSQTDFLLMGTEHPEKAVDLARDLQPALITLDVMMPQMDGWELLQSFKLDPQTSHIPIIVCSAWDDPNLSHTLGAAAFLKKPVTQKMLIEAIQKVLPAD